VLRIEAELHDGQRMQIFNVHQATSGDVQLQQHAWQILAKSVVECKHQRILLGGDLNANANGTRVGYAESNAEHMTKVDALLENFVHDTQGELMSPSTVSWRRDNKSAKLDHIIA
jgi:endonuclease/exonuclease/phosphatase family metal-dependent hydrolase